MSGDRPGVVREGEAMRLPNEPYPGLRPFLNHESSLLLGRERQVREVIARLQQTQFVAVIGGSGSGKSSLVLAGVVPELRSFGIPEAGDFWVPMTCTPGTNVSAADAANARHTPITRLAWKFAKLLKPAASPEAEALRLDDIATVFRQEAGFARLIDTYGDELQLRAGPAPDQLRLLFVIDQFEELFHPTNKGIDDAGLLVERVIDHFFSPHPRCFVVLTMRSEHLNDCAGYLELPDAINKSSYLVRRLDEAELREAIVGPSQRYLRLLQRGEAGLAAGAPVLPPTVAFDVAVVDRLMRDVSAITHDPDHLPLLQHLLARLWEAAFAREGVRHGVPAAITWADLAVAVGGPFDERSNLLRASLENRAEAVYQLHPPAQRAGLDAVLRRLAFKDPNTGMYTQQRIDVDDPTLFGPGVANPRDKLHALIADGFIGSVDYLFWDDENPQRTTLKVSHESFIRGWARFRRWADEEDRQFQVYLRLLDDCARWTLAERADASLSSGQTLRLYEDAELDSALHSPEAMSRFARLLAMDRDGQRVAPMAGAAIAFLERSRANRDARAAERERTEAQQRVDREQAEAARREAVLAEERVRRVKLTRWALAFVLAGIGMFAAAELQLARKERTLHRSYALAAETQVGFQPQFAGFDGGQPALLGTLMGTQFLDTGSAMVTGLATWPPLNLLYAERLAGLQRTERLSQTRNSASLRTVLQGGAWPVVKAGSGFESPIARAQPRPCGSANFGPQDRSAELQGARFFARPAPDDERGLIVSGVSADGMSVFAGRMPRGSSACELDSPLISTPPLGATGARVDIGLAADLSNLVFFFPDSLQFHTLLWGDSKQVQSRPRAVVLIDAASAAAMPADPVTVLESGNAPFATDVRIGARTMRLFDVEPTPIAAAAANAAIKLEDTADAGVCAAFADSLKIDGADRVVVLTTPPAADAPTWCLHLRTAAGGALWLGTLYAFRDEADARDTLKRAPLYLDLVLGATRPAEYRIDTRAGWLAFSGDGRSWRAVPWSVQALRGLARPVFAPAPTSSGKASWAGSSQLKLIVGADDHGDAELPKRLESAPEQPRKVAP
ncbi:MAG: hypothetical protein ABI781_15865 [Burkholderiales bacterium]